MASSTEKIILVVILLIICCFAYFGIMPMFFLRGHMPIEGHLLGLPGILHMAALPLLLLSVVWLFVVVWVYRDAERRGMSGVLWALLVLVGNFVGLLIYLIVRNDELSRQFASGLTEPCPGCGKVVAQKFAFCPHCGTRMKAVCPSCDEPVSSGWKVCPHCGEKLADKK